MTPSKYDRIGLRVGVDLGGTKIDIVGLGPNGITRDRQRMATPQGSYAATVKAIIDLVHGMEQKLGEEGTFGLCIPGIVSPDTGLVKNANSAWLNGHSLDADLATALGRPVRLANDANCFALSEAVDGAGQGHETVFGVILGTGVGGGVVIRGEINAGRNMIGGEWGHNQMPWMTADEYPGEPCNCGLKGCIETFLSGGGLTRAYRQLTGTELQVPEVVALADRGDAPAGTVLAQYERHLARALASVINILDPEVIVLGGGLSQIDRLYENVPRLWADYIFSDSVHTRLKPPVHGDASGVRGAAWLWPEAP